MRFAIPDAGVASQSVSRGDDGLRVVVTASAAGADLAPHATSRQAVIGVRSGEVPLRLGDAEVTAAAGAQIRMDPGLTHAVAARTPAVRCLTLPPG